MTDYLIVKTLHILSATFLFGTGVGTAFYLLVTTLGRDVRVVAAVTRWVVIADWLFTATTAIAQPLTGWWLAQRMGMPVMEVAWLRWSVHLYALAIACWLPVVWLQMRLRDLAAGGPGAAPPPPPPPTRPGAPAARPPVSLRRAGASVDAVRPRWRPRRPRC